MINRFINFLKWPTALLMAWLLPASLMLLWRFIIAQHYSLLNIPPIIIGLAGYLFLWNLLFRRKELGSYFSTLEHEFTHAFFALLTGHSLKGMRVTAHEGGQIVYKGGSGNWLITISPYFFPTITILLLTVRLFIRQNYWFEMGIGASIAFHITSTYLETHGAQTDLKSVGKIFSWFFLPTANILSLTLIGEYLQSGWRGISSAVVFLWLEVSSYSFSSYHFLYAHISK